MSLKSQDIQTNPWIMEKKNILEKTLLNITPAFNPVAVVPAPP